MGLMAERFFSGHESWVFEARTVSELCGHHATLIGSALRRGEPIDHLVYSPLREIDAGPFGLTRLRGSHALAVTSDRFVVSRDPHRPGQAASVRQAPFADVLTVELGEALTLGWFIVRFVANGQVESEVVCFQSSGIEHFRAAVRAWQAHAGPPAVPEPRPGPPDDERSRWPPHLRGQLLPLLPPGERPRLVLYAGEVWRRGPARRRLACASPETACAVTARTLLVAQSEAPPRRGALVFGVNVTLVERGAVTRLVTPPGGAPRPAVTTCTVVVERGGVRHEVEVRLGHLPSTAAGALAGALRLAEPSVAP